MNDFAKLLLAPEAMWAELLIRPDPSGDIVFFCLNFVAVEPKPHGKCLEKLPTTDQTGAVFLILILENSPESILYCPVLSAGSAWI